MTTANDEVPMRPSLPGMQRCAVLGGWLAVASVTGLVGCSSAPTEARARTPSLSAPSDDGHPPGGCVVRPSCAQLEAQRKADDAAPEVAADSLPLSTVSTVSPSDRAPAEARERVSSARMSMDDPAGARWDEALEQLERAWRIYPSWKVAGALARCAAMSERDGLAIDAYERFLAGPDGPDRHVPELERQIRELRKNTVTVHLTHVSTGNFIEDQRAAEPTGTGPSSTVVRLRYNAPGPSVSLRVRPGKHVFRVVSAPPWEVELLPGTEVRHAFVPPVAECTDR